MANGSKPVTRDELVAFIGAIAPSGVGDHVPVNVEHTRRALEELQASWATSDARKPGT